MRSARDTDARLLAKMPAPEAVAQFYERHVGAVYGFAVRRCDSPEDVADLVATVFLEVFGAARSFKSSRGPARPWLLGIAARCLADMHRADQRHRELAQRSSLAPALAEDEYELVERAIDAARLAPAVETALTRHLTSAERTLFLLVSHDGISVADAARCLGLSPVAGRMRLSRARRKLRHAISPAGAEEPVAGEPTTIVRGES